MRPNAPPPPAPSIPVRVVEEHQAAHDESYEAPVYYFFAVPRVGDDFYEVRRGGQVRYVVKEVAHVLELDPQTGPAQVEHQIVIGEPAAPHPPRAPRLIRPSRN